MLQTVVCKFNSKGDWDKLLKESPIDKDGKIEIPFMDYEIEQELFEEIIDKVILEFKIRKYRIPTIKSTLYLGCSPKYKL